ncbi:hypothetical protein GCM10009788_11240 [Nocardioides humi]|uniref:Uncharacterized protein n=1 Tax=Nocardioides humi TaxID=449461 RepID=A0ABN2A0X2_9ACTN
MGLAGEVAKGEHALIRLLGFQLLCCHLAKDIGKLPEVQKLIEVEAVAIDHVSTVLIAKDNVVDPSGRAAACSSNR